MPPSSPAIPRSFRRLALAFAVLAGLGGAQARAQDAFTAVATIGMLGDVVANVVGDAGTVETLVGSGVDPHTYQLTRADTSRLVTADIVFYVGLFLEGKMVDALRSLADDGRPVHAIGEELGSYPLLAPEEFLGHADPHVWMDVAGWIDATEAVRARMAEFRPALAETFAANAEAYVERLRALDSYARDVLSSVQPESRVLVTAHDAFNYFGRAYGFEVLGIQGLSTESEAGLQRISELVDVLVARGVPAVFVETTVPERNVRALIEGAASRGHEVVIGGSLFSDAMGAPGSYEGSYVGMIDHNVTTIAAALGGTPPERGLNGQLARAN